MAFLKPLWMQPFAGDSAIEYLPDQDRLGLLGSVFSREGVIDFLGNHLKVSQRAAGANLSVDVAAGRCVIVGDDVADQGKYLCQSNSVANVPLSKPASGTRTHVVIAQVRDKAANPSWSGYDWTLTTVFSDSGTPAVPASAISLATVSVSSSATSVTNSNIGDGRKQATVGTPSLTGTWGQTGMGNWGADDSTRPLTWTKNPDGWVQLGGWLNRKNVAMTANANEFYFWDGTVGWSNNTTATPVLPADARPVGGVRDFIGITSLSDVHFVVFPNGTMAYRFFNTTTLTASNPGMWISFDGCMFRANSF